MIPCKDHVKKIAVYKDRLAVQLPERVVVYELKGGAQGDNASDMQYKKKDTINEKKWSAPDSKVKMIKIPEDQMDEFRKIAGKPVWDKWVADNKGDFDAQGLFDLVMKAGRVMVER